MTRPDISKLVDKNGVPYEIEGYVQNGTNKPVKIASFMWSKYWRIAGENELFYIASDCEYIPPKRTLNEIKDDMLCVWFDAEQPLSKECVAPIVDSLFNEAYELGLY